MTPEQIVIIQTSFEALATHTQDLSTNFYDRLFKLNPSIRKLFPSNMAEQQHKFMTILNLAVNGLWYPETVIPVLQQLGARHIRYGMQPAHFASVEEALLTSIQQMLGPQYTPEVAEAWTSAYRWIASSMLPEPSSGAESSSTVDSA